LGYYRKGGKVRPIFAPRGGKRPVIIVLDRQETRSIRRQPFTLANIEQLSDQPGFYTLYDENGKLLYAGSSRNIRQRLLDTIYGRGDARTVDSKARLLPRIVKMDVTYGSVNQSRLNERRIKHVAEYNARD